MWLCVPAPVQDMGTVLTLSLVWVLGGWRGTPGTLQQQPDAFQHLIPAGMRDAGSFPSIL